MTAPGWTAVRWSAGRLALLVVIIVVLVAVRLFGDESRLLLAELTGFMPDAGLVERLEAGRQELEAFARAESDEARRRLEAVASAGPGALDRSIAATRASLEEKKRSSRGGTQRALALLTGRGFEADLRRDVEIQVLTAELAALERLGAERDARRMSVAGAGRAYERARLDVLAVHGEILAVKRLLDRLERDDPLLVRVPGTAQFGRFVELHARLESLRERGRGASEAYWQAKDDLETAQSAARTEASLLTSAARSALQPLDELIGSKREAAARAQHRLAAVEREARDVFWSAVAILVAVTLAPIGIKAFWYYVAAPAASRRPPIRLLAHASGAVDPPVDGGGGGDGRDGGADARRPRMSAVSQEISFDGEQELLVHPEYLQSSPDRAVKETKWLWDWRLPFTSLASGMIALTRIRATTRETAVISDTRDPFGEIGVITLPQGSALALQPRNLVGVVQRRAQPLEITRHWRLASLSAWLTLQFRYLVFHGPATLILQGCRGIRVETAGRGRSIDQVATIGFSANVAYSTTRSETFGAYLMGKRGLFNDNFAAGPGVYVYEEMPYRGRRSGITGRGLEGIVDAALKALGV